MVRVKTQRDKHGGETLLLTHAGAGGQASVVIYAHRTIPGLRLGRHPFDEETIQLLERTYPHLEFDWAKILRTSAASLTAPAPEAFSPQRPVRGRPAPSDEETGASGRRGSDGGGAPVPQDARRPDTSAQADVGHVRAPAVETPPPRANGPEAGPQSRPSPPASRRRRERNPRVAPAVTSGSSGSPGTPGPASSVSPALANDHTDTGAEGVELEGEDEGTEQGAEMEGLAPAGGNTARSLTAGSVAERHAALVQRIQQRVRDPQRQAALLAQAAALQPSLWVEPLDHDGAIRFEQLHAALRRQLPSRRRRARRRGPGAGEPRLPSTQGERARSEQPGE